METSANWYHIAHTPDGIVVHKLPPDEAGASPERVDELISQRSALAEQIRQSLGFPEGWFTQAEWTSHLAPGLPGSFVERGERGERTARAGARYSEEFAGGNPGIDRA